MADGSGGGARSIVRRRPLPGNRAVVGGLLVTIAAVGAFAIASPGTGSGRAYVVAATDLSPGQRISRADLTTAEIDLPDSVAAGAFDSVEHLDGAVMLAPAGRGELVQASAALVASGAEGDAVGAVGLAEHEVSLGLDRDRAANGDLRPGERVDVLATYGSGESATTLVLVRSAIVRSITVGTSTIGSTGTVVLSLGVGPADDVIALVHAARAGEVTVVRSSRAAPSSLVPERYRPPTGEP